MGWLEIGSGEKIVSVVMPNYTPKSQKSKSEWEDVVIDLDSIRPLKLDFDLKFTGFTKPYKMGDKNFPLPAKFEQLVWKGRKKIARVLIYLPPEMEGATLEVAISEKVKPSG